MIDLSFDAVSTLVGLSTLSLESGLNGFLEESLKPLVRETSGEKLPWLLNPSSLGSSGVKPESISEAVALLALRFLMMIFLVFFAPRPVYTSAFLASEPSMALAMGFIVAVDGRAKMFLVSSSFNTN